MKLRTRTTALAAAALLTPVGVVVATTPPAAAHAPVCGHGWHLDVRHPTYGVWFEDHWTTANHTHRHRVRFRYRKGPLSWHSWTANYTCRH